jgi:hypothetical protein
MKPVIEKEMEQLAEAVPGISEEIEMASDEDATPVEIEKAKQLAADFLTKYDELIKHLEPEDKMEVQRRIGLKVEHLKGKLTRLREAPE